HRFQSGQQSKLNHMEESAPRERVHTFERRNFLPRLKPINGMQRESIRTYCKVLKGRRGIWTRSQLMLLENDEGRVRRLQMNAIGRGPASFPAGPPCSQ